MTTLLTMKGFNKQVQYLCFTANTAGSTVALIKNGSPTSVTLETSTDGSTRTTYTIGSTITLSNIGDKVYWRNKSETTTGFSTSGSACYYFTMTGSIAASGDINYLLNKNSTDTLVSDYCYYFLFMQCTSLTSAPELTATNLTNYCYCYMFYGCTNLITAPELPATILARYCYQFMFYGCTALTVSPKLVATTLANYCYAQMFRDCTNLTTLPKIIATTLNMYCCQLMFYQCSKIKLSATQTGEYQTPYRIPDTGTGILGTEALDRMFTSTGGTFTGTPTINTTYYTSNQVI